MSKKRKRKKQKQADGGATISAAVQGHSGSIPSEECVVAPSSDLEIEVPTAPTEPPKDSPTEAVNNSTKELSGSEKEPASALLAPNCYPPPSLVRRVAAFVFDLLVLAIVATLIIGIATALLIYNFAQPIDTVSTMLLTHYKRGFLLSVALAAFVTWLYFPYFESSKYQATPGKLIFELAVTNDDGTHCKFLRAHLRLSAALLTCFSLGIGFAAALFHPQRQALHDRLSHTLVVSAKKSSSAA